MLEQAIVDAAALKEAAMKNAEAAIIEKYSPEIKKAVDSLLEQIEDPEAFFGEEEPALESPAVAAVSLTPEEESLLEQIPFTGSEELETVPGVVQEDEQVELVIDIADLAAQLDQDQEEGDVNHRDMVDRGEILEPEVDTEIPVEIGEDIPFELYETELKAILEELEFDYDPKPSGWAVGADKPTAEMEENYALLASIGELEVANEKTKKENDNLKESVELFEKMMQDYKRRTEKYSEVVKQLENKLNEVNLANARLLYSNRALNSASLNERQKKKIVESISKAQTIEEAKVIYETLESAVGEFSTERRKKPKSLGEAVSRNSSPFYPMRKERTQQNVFADRMKILAGIKK
tara:strand:+ start:693 stop:1745 length:1053 start_codon:yes stop_codon:yes gene_type:complete